MLLTKTASILTWIKEINLLFICSTKQFSRCESFIYTLLGLSSNFILISYPFSISDCFFQSSIDSVSTNQFYHIIRYGNGQNNHAFVIEENGSLEMKNNKFTDEKLASIWKHTFLRREERTGGESVEFCYYQILHIEDEDMYYASWNEN